ncbi:MAG: hypothetical protein ACK2UU_07470, partial [Anaerolineae bacterium]
MQSGRNYGYLFLVMLILPALLLSACGAQPTEAPEATTAAEPTKEEAAPTEAVEEPETEETLVFGVVPKITHPFYDDVL